MPTSAPVHDDARMGLALRGALGVLSLALLAATFRALFDYDPTQLGHDDGDAGEVAFFSPTGNAPFFVYAVSAWLFFERRAAFFSALGTPANVPIAIAALTGALGFVAWATHTDAPDLLLPGLALAWVGSAAVLGGAPAARACWLPAATLVALVPIPAVWIHHVVFPLQIATAEISVALLHLLGVEAVQMADRLVVGREHIFQVIESCSGLRSTQTIALSALLYGQIFQRGRGHWLALLALSPPLGLFINELRVMSLIFNPYSSFAAVHSAQGLSMLVLGVLSIAGVDWLLLRVLPRSMSESRGRVTAPARAPLAAPRIALVAGGCALLLAASFAPRAPQSAAGLVWEPADLPIRIGEWKSNPSTVDRIFLGSSRFTEDTARIFERGADRVHVYVGVMERSARPGAVQTPKTIPLGTQRPYRRARKFVDPVVGRNGEMFNVSTPEGRERVLRWHAGTCGLACEGFRSLLAVDRSAFQRDGVGYAVRVSTPFPVDTPAKRADALLLDFAARFEAAIEATRERRERERQPASTP